MKNTPPHVSGDTASRRRCSQDLLRSMCRQFESEATQIALAHVNTMLAEFATSPTEKWTQKDAAVSERPSSQLMSLYYFGISINNLTFFTMPYIDSSDHGYFYSL